MTRISHLCVVAAVVAVCVQVPAAAQDFGDTGDAFAAIEADLKADDLGLIEHSHLTLLRQWRGVRPAPRRDEQPAASAWEIDRDNMVRPLGDGPATTVIPIPVAGKYRMWLRYQAQVSKPTPVTLTIQQGQPVTHTYGAEGLSTLPGKTQEQKRPIAFESEMSRMSPPRGPTVIWEYFDTELKAGEATLELRSGDAKVRVDALFACRSPSFRPSLSSDPASNNLSRTFVRLRVTPAERDSGKVTVQQTNLTYHWRRILKPGGEPLWYDSLTNKLPVPSEGGRAPLEAGQWSAWLDVSDVLSGPGGPWATASMVCTDVPAGKLDLQLAWQPREAAVLKTLTTAIASSRAVLTVPVEREGYEAPAPAPAQGAETASTWGVRSADYLARVRSAESFAEQHQKWADEALAKISFAQQVRPQRIKLISGVHAAPSVQAEAVKMLSDLGANTIWGATAEQREKHQLNDMQFVAASDALFNAHTHCPMDPQAQANLEKLFQRRGGAGQQESTLLKMGDEIGPIVSPVHINRCTDCRAAFHDYLRQVAKEHSSDASFFGGATFEELPFVPQARLDLTRSQRRLYYHSIRYQFLHTARFYRRMTAAAEKTLPNPRSYCNFSPHPPMFGGHMNGSDWFVLTRAGGATMGWAEDWASGGSWGMAGYETVGYYGALVACASRPHDLPMGFYNVITCGAGDRKIISLVSQGIHNIVLYSFGPLYAGAEFSNFWSEMPRAYEQVARGSLAIGPADQILAEGRREPARVALLYNRSHEIWHGGFAGVQTDRLLTFIALRQAQLPVDIVLEEDLTVEGLKPYRVVYLTGLNLGDEQAAALAQWVTQGGVLVTSGGAGMFDRYNDWSTPAAELLGVQQRVAAVSDGSWHALNIPQHKPVGALTVEGGDGMPSLKVPVVGIRTALTPTANDVRIWATFEDGTPAATRRAVGQGQVLVMGFSPGLIFKGQTEGSSRYTMAHRPLVTAPAEKSAPATLQYTAAQTEATRFDHDTGLAITLNNFGADADADAELSIRTDRPVTRVQSSARGELKWKRDGDWIRVQCPAPNPVDVVTLR